MNPPSRSQFALAYDSIRNRTLMFGGQDSSYSRSDTWEYDGNAWVLRTTGGPPARIAPAIAFDAVRGITVLFGGQDQNAGGRYYGDTWEWNGSYWLELLTAGGPGARRGIKAVFDATIGRTVIYGGASLQTGLAADTWEWDGVLWKDRSGAKGPPAMSDHAMCFDSRRGRVLLVGAATNTMHVWERFMVADPQARWTAFGLGCAGTAGVPSLMPDSGQLPWIGETLVVRIGNVPGGALRVPFGLLGASKTSWSGVPLPFDLGAIGMAGCTLLVRMDLTVALNAVSGVATWSIAFPPEPAFVGAKLYQQALVLDPTANILGATTSNAGELSIGVR